MVLWLVIPHRFTMPFPQSIRMFLVFFTLSVFYILSRTCWLCFWDNSNSHCKTLSKVSVSYENVSIGKQCHIVEDDQHCSNSQTMEKKHLAVAIPNHQNLSAWCIENKPANQKYLQNSLPVNPEASVAVFSVFKKV